jgi:hypothetical protein
VIDMRLSKLLSLILAQTSLEVKVPNEQDENLSEPKQLRQGDLHCTIFSLVREACIKQGLSEHGADAFAGFIAELVTDLPAENVDEEDIMRLYRAFHVAAFGSIKQVVRLSTLPTWGTLGIYLDDLRIVVFAAFVLAKSL